MNEEKTFTIVTPTHASCVDRVGLRRPAKSRHSRKEVGPATLTQRSERRMSSSGCAEKRTCSAARQQQTSPDPFPPGKIHGVSLATEFDASCTTFVPNSQMLEKQSSTTVTGHDPCTACCAVQKTEWSDVRFYVTLFAAFHAESRRATLLPPSKKHAETRCISVLANCLAAAPTSLQMLVLLRDTPHVG